MFAGMRAVEVPCPALAAADLHLVVRRVLCPVTCAPCWAVLCAGIRTLRCPPRARRGPCCPSARRVVHASATATCSTSWSWSVQQLDLPVRPLNADVELAQLGGELVGLGAQPGNRQHGEVAETEYTAFTSKKGQAITARLIVRRIKDLNRRAGQGQNELFPVWRYHAVFTDTPFVMPQAEGDHRNHAVVEQVFADWTDGPLAHLPSGSFPANAAWLVLAAISHNLLRRRRPGQPRLRQGQRSHTALRPHRRRRPHRPPRPGRNHLAPA
jgi:hypothetical protein